VEKGNDQRNDISKIKQRMGFRRVSKRHGYFFIENGCSKIIIG
jgi:hypothetical protein